MAFNTYNTLGGLSRVGDGIFGGRISRANKPVAPVWSHVAGHTSRNGCGQIGSHKRPSKRCCKKCPNLQSVRVWVGWDGGGVVLCPALPCSGVDSEGWPIAADYRHACIRFAPTDQPGAYSAVHPPASFTRRKAHLIKKKKNRSRRFHHCDDSNPGSRDPLLCRTLYTHMLSTKTRTLPPFSSDLVTAVLPSFCRQDCSTKQGSIYPSPHPTLGDPQ